MCSIVTEDLQRETSSKPEDSIVDLIGEWGPWQRRTVFLIFLCKIPAAWLMSCIIFTAPFAKYREFYCQQPLGVSPANYTEWIRIAHPTIEGDQIDFCRVYVNQTDALYDWHRREVTAPQSSNTKNCDKFEHKSVFNSLVTQFDLVCSRTILIAVTQFFHLCGVLTGGILATKLLDL